ncbi:MAG: PIN domain-containing protein [Dehalococcoidia bacterium]|nr:PIN domain-containing protein [Chloroflexi bacterium CFX7]MCK6565740.1 PIN domain-containing protein [Dehalococcoidia bacterium]NUQ54788.1 PIN domain-containing protein [Dehalococcoidia bacterium]
MTTYLCDVNVWVALALAPHSYHQPARAWLESAGDSDRILFCRATQQSFLRLLTTTSVLAPYGLPPLSNAAAWTAYEALIADSRICFEAEPDGVDQPWRAFTFGGAASPKLWMDAYLAAFARAAGCRLVTTDQAFRQFEGLDLLLLGPPHA